MGTHADANRARAINRVGQKSGIQVIESFSHFDEKGYRHWTVLCGCGSRRTISQRGKSFGHSCGCLTKAILAESRRTHGQSSGHGRRGSQTYRCWKSMMDRCTYSTRRDWMDYGGRGISVCERWKTFANFFADMGVAEDGMTLDRMDTNGNYEPGNCRWATAKEQANNRRSNRIITYGGVTKTLTQWAEALDIKHDTLSKRFSSGMELSRAMTPGKMRITRPYTRKANAVLRELSRGADNGAN